MHIERRERERERAPTPDDTLSAPKDTPPKSAFGFAAAAARGAIRVPWSLSTKQDTKI